MTILFASLHQTVTIIVWVTCYLTLRPESQEAIRKESQCVTRPNETGYQESPPEEEKMQEATVADSFIREILRMKGDSVDLVRAAIRDVELGGYLIPKGSILLPITYLSYRSPDFTSQPDEFDAERWVGSGNPLQQRGQDTSLLALAGGPAQAATLPYLIKSWILALVRSGRLELEGNKYEIIDPYNMASVAPKGRLRVRLL
ncbi:cytochrome P450 [Penicillium samsonianum]|uniref:cytochrome P450 n=1 Tax=Penicillium samsonianum TaxID=1882272 RepID=UPI002548EF4B|nr:cytochrome P450 [Penicillium samsonianum]KAJ6143604.1 cytochrome P450 [Penicillium samsonianum]